MTALKDNQRNNAIFSYQILISFFNIELSKITSKYLGGMTMSILEKFANGKLFLSGQETDISAITWSNHANFSGVALKHLITAKDTNSKFSYHLVRIAPHKKIGEHLHETQLETHEIIAGSGICHSAGQALVYQVGNVVTLPAGIKHEVCAGNDGLLLLAKFFPALC